jgi:hypothetical protein
MVADEPGTDRQERRGAEEVGMLARQLTRDVRETARRAVALAG